jgi:hypothetical protein
MTGTEAFALELLHDFMLAAWPIDNAADTASDFTGVSAERLVSLATISE